MVRYTERQGPDPVTISCGRIKRILCSQYICFVQFPMSQRVVHTVPAREEAVPVPFRHTWVLEKSQYKTPQIIKQRIPQIPGDLVVSSNCRGTRNYHTCTQVTKDEKRRRNITKDRERK